MRRLILPVVLATLTAAGSVQAQVYPPPSYQPQGYPPPDYQPPSYAPSPEQLVDSWYRRFMRRPPDASAQQWVDKLRGGMSPEQTLSLILGSSDYYMRIAHGDERNWVVQAFTDLAGRPPTPREFQRWMRQLYDHNRNYVAYDLVDRFPQSVRGGGAYEPDYDYARPFDYYRQ